MHLPVSLAVLLGLVTLLAPARPLPAADKPTKGVEGFWEGTLKVGAIELRLIFTLERKPDGTLAGTLDSPDQGAKDIPIEEVTFQNGAVVVNVKKVGGVYEGKLSKDGQQIEGQWKQAGMTFPLVLKRIDKLPETRRPQEPKKPYPYAVEEVTFENKEAGVKLAGTLTLPRGKGPFPAVLLISGSGPQDRDEAIFGHRPFLVLADHLTRRGIAVLRVDDRGVGGSTGDFAKATSADFAGDVLAGVAYLKTRQEINPRQIGLIGHSEGGLIAPMVAVKSKDVAFIVLLAGPGLPGDEVLALQGQAILKAMGASEKDLALQQRLQRRFFMIVREEKDDEAARKKIQAAIEEELAKLDDDQRKAAEKMKGNLEGQVKLVTSPWFRYFLTYDPRPALRRVRVPVLAVVGEKDLQVLAKENLSEIAKALKEGGNTDYTLKEFPGLNHLFQTCKTGAPTEYGKIEETFAPEALDYIADWIVKRTIGETKPSP